MKASDHYHASPPPPAYQPQRSCWRPSVLPARCCVQMLWHRVRNQPGAPTNAQAKAWLAQAPDNPPPEAQEPEPAGKMVMRNGKYVVVKPGEKKSKAKAAAAEPEPEPEPEQQPAPEPVSEEPKEVDPEDDPNLSEQEKKAIRRAKEKVRSRFLADKTFCKGRDFSSGAFPPQAASQIRKLSPLLLLEPAGGSRAAQSRARSC